VWVIGPASLAAAALLLPTTPAPAPVLPELPVPEEGCVVPVGRVLPPCPSPDRTPLISCVLPVSRFTPPRLEPDCPAPVPDPRGRTVPLSR
jgi:hypothetical protein